MPCPLVLVVLAAAPVPAAPKADALPPSAAQLLAHRRVQKELKMTAEQRLAVLDGLADLDEEYDARFAALARLPNAGDDRFAALNAEQRRAVAALLAGAADRLSAGQRERLRQLDLRVRGPAALADPRVAAALRLSDDQKKKAGELAGRLGDAASRYRAEAGNEETAVRRADLLAVRKAVQKEAAGLLTAGQKPGWAELLGPAPVGFVAEDLWAQLVDAEPADGR